jgi:biopolymer transport protein ExbD
MSKFRKGGKRKAPGINTSALPDIIFMLLFFFMVATTSKDMDPMVKVKRPKSSEATDLTPFKQRNEIDFVFVGLPLKASMGDQVRVQLDGSLEDPVRIGEWKKIQAEGRGVAIEKVITCLKTDENVSYGFIHDMKESLRDVKALTIAYGAEQGKVKLD